MEEVDQELIRRVIKGERRWIRKFHQHYRKKLLSFVLLKVDDPRDAEEIVQDTLVSAIYCLPSFLGKSSLWSWLGAIAKHEIADFYRKKKIKAILFSHFPALETVISKALSPELALEEKEMKEKILRVFSSLTEGYREILRLKYIEGLSVRQIAARFQKSVKAIEMRLRRARFAFIESWHAEKIGQEGNFAFSQRELSFLEKCLGFAGPSLPDAEGY